MDSNRKPFWQGEAVQIAGVLAIGAVVALLFRLDGGPSVAGSSRNAGERKAMGEIVATDLSGGTWKLSAHRGDVVLVNFWASWCPPCREETPGLVRIANEYKGRGLEVVGISMDDSADPVRQFVSRFHVPYTVAMPAADSPLVSAIESLPTSFLVDRNGRVATVYSGAVTEGELRGEIDRLLQER